METLDQILGIYMGRDAVALSRHLLIIPLEIIAQGVSDPLSHLFGMRIEHK